MSEWAIYEHYANWCERLGIVPATFDVWRYLSWKAISFKWN